MAKMTEKPIFEGEPKMRRNEMQKLHFRGQNLFGCLLKHNFSDYNQDILSISYLVLDKCQTSNYLSKFHISKTASFK